MLKVFLVEDEVIMRNGIKNSISWEKEGFDFVGEASDGELAYPLIKKEKPDILITDIKMPFMDGLELSRIIKKEFPQIKIIILSGYDDFDYAQTAISIGVTDYLLKPISSVKLLEAVKQVADQIKKEQEQELLIERYRKEMEENVILEKQKLWNALASNQLSAVELLEKGQSLGMDFSASAYNVFLFKLMPDGEGAGYSAEMTELIDRVQEMSSEWKQVLVFDRGPDGWVFLLKGNDETEIGQLLKSYSIELTDLMKKYPEIEYYGGVGSTVHRLGDIQNSYQNAASAFSTRFFLESNRILRYDEVSRLHTVQSGKIDMSNIRSQKSEQELIEKFLRSGSIEEIEGFLDEYFLNVGEKNVQSLLYRQYVIMNLYFSLTDFLGSLGIGMDRLPENYQDINIIVGNAISEELTRSVIVSLFHSAMTLRDTSSRKKYGEMLTEAKRYIDENYQSEDMSLKTVAAQVNTSPSYFSATFSAEMGETFVEYLTKVRLEKAKELLMCSNLRTAEIGYEVGYKDSHYFSYIFKKVVGCSPKDYKKRGKE